MDDSEPGGVVYEYISPDHGRNSRTLRLASVALAQKLRSPVIVGPGKGRKYVHNHHHLDKSSHRDSRQREQGMRRT